MQDHVVLGLILLAVMIGLGIQVVAPFWAPIAWAAILAYVTTPIYQRILRLLNGRPSLAAGVMTTIMLVILLVPTSFLLARLPRELAESYDTESG